MKLHDCEAIEIKLWKCWGSVEKVLRRVWEMVEKAQEIFETVLKKWWENVWNYWEGIEKVLSVKKIESLKEGLWESLD